MLRSTEPTLLSANVRQVPKADIEPFDTNLNYKARMVRLHLYGARTSSAVL